MIQKSFAHLNARQFRREMRELIEELQYVHKDSENAIAFHRFDGCGKGHFSGSDRILGKGEDKGLDICFNSACKSS
jgi:hypothetical protein